MLRTEADGTGEDDVSAPSSIVDDLRDMSVLQQLATRTAADDDPQRIYDEILAAAIRILRSDAGTVQLHDEAREQLVIQSTRGFSKEMTLHFARVDAGCSSPCGIALANKTRSLVDFDIPEEDDHDGSARMHREAGYLSAQSTPLVSRTGRVVGMVSTHWRSAHRPTDRELRFLDLLVRQAADAIDRHHQEGALRAREERQRFLLELSDRLSTIGDANEVMAVALEAIARRIGADGGGYVDVEDEDTLIVGMQYVGPGMPRRRPIRTSAREITNGLAELMRSDAGFFVEDLRTDPIYTDAGRGFGAQMGAISAAAVPLNKDGRWVAYLYLIGKTARPWSATDRQLIRDVAERTWAAVGRARAEQALGEDLANNERLRELGELLARLDVETNYHAVAETALQITKGEGCTLWILDERSGSFRNVATRGTSRAAWSPIARQLLSGDHAPKTPSSTRAFSITAFGGRTVGVLSVEWPEPLVCTQRELRFADLLVRQLGTFIERQHAELVLRESQQRLATQLQGARELQAISAELLVEQNIESLYDKVVGAALALMRADAASMQAFERGENELRLIANRGFPAEYRDFSLRVGGDSELASGRALATGSRVIIEDVDALDAPRGSQVDIYRASGIRSVVAMPLRARRGHVIGMLSVHWKYAHVPSPESLQLLDLLGRQASDLVAQREQEQALRVSEERHGFLLQLADLLRQQTDLDAMWSAASRLVGKQFGANRAWIADLDAKRGMATVRPDWAQEGLSSIAGAHGAAALREVLPDLCKGHPLIIDDIEHSPLLSPVARDSLRERGIYAFATVPLFSDGECWSLSVSSATPRTWKTDAIMLLHEATDRIGGAHSRLRAELGVRMHEELLDIAFESSGAGRFIWDLTTNAVQSDELLRQLLGVPPELEVTMQSIGERIHVDDLAGLGTNIRHALEPSGSGTLRCELRIVREDGSLRWVGCHGRVLFEGEARAPVRLVGTMLALRRDEPRAHIRLAGTAIIELDVEGVITAASERWARSLGYEASELQGRSIYDLTTPEDREGSREAVDRLIAGERSTTHDERYIRKDGTLKAMRCIASAHRAPDGRVLRMRALLVDLD